MVPLRKTGGHMRAMGVAQAVSQLTPEAISAAQRLAHVEEAYELGV